MEKLQCETCLKQDVCNQKEVLEKCIKEFDDIYIYVEHIKKTRSEIESEYGFSPEIACNKYINSLIKREGF